MSAASLLTVFAALASTPATQVKNGEELIRAMHARYAGKWFKTLSFVQRAIFSDGRPEQEWWEAAIVPGGLRIDIMPQDSMRATVYRGDSTFSFNQGKLVRAAKGRNILEVLAFDVYNQDPARTIQITKEEGFDLSLLKEDSWKGKAAYVVGTATQQLWIEKERLILLRVIEAGPNGSSSDISFDKFVKLGGGWLGTEVVFVRDGKLFFHEVYRDWKINPDVTPELFQVPPYKPAAWITKR